MLINPDGSMVAGEIEINDWQFRAPWGNRQGIYIEYKLPHKDWEKQTFPLHVLLDFLAEYYDDIEFLNPDKFSDYWDEQGIEEQIEILTDFLEAKIGSL
jgi:hypothetical protein